SRGCIETEAVLDPGGDRPRQGQDGVSLSAACCDIGGGGAAAWPAGGLHLQMGPAQHLRPFGGFLLRRSIAGFHAGVPRSRDSPDRGKAMAQQRMLQFVSRPREMPEKRTPEHRRTDFAEIYRDYAEGKAREQASRCSQCGVPYCQVHCPLQNNIPDWLMLTAQGRLRDAYELSQSTNNFPEICGRICPQDRLCEGNCVIEQAGHGTVTIGSVEKFITDTAFEQGWVRPILPAIERALSV